MCRLVSLLLAIIMVIAMMPVALADEVVELEEIVPDMNAAAAIEDVSVAGEAASYVETTIAEEAAPSVIEEIAPLEGAAQEVIGDIIPDAVIDVNEDVAAIFVEGYIHVYGGTVVYDASKATRIGAIANNEIVLGFADANPDWLLVTFDLNGQVIEGCILAANAMPLSLAETQDYVAKLAQHPELRVCRNYAVPVASSYISDIVGSDPVADVIPVPVIANDQASAVEQPVEPVVDYLPDADDIEILALTVAINTEDAATQAVVEEIEEIVSAPVEAVSEEITADVEAVDDAEIKVDVALAAGDEGLKGLVERCYNLILRRPSEEAGLLWHVNKIKNGEMTVAEDVWNFVDSDELRAQNLSDQKTIELLYRTMLNRDADEGGLLYWMRRITVGASLKFIVSQFAASYEFQDICKTYGVQPGTLETYYRDKDIGNTAFAYRCYKEVLLRAPETDGIEYWARILYTKEQNHRQVADGFLFSNEALAKKWNDKQFIERLYHLYMNRNPEPNGEAYWLDKLSKGMTRQQVSAEFSNSPEFISYVENPMLIIDGLIIDLEPIGDPNKDFEFELNEAGDGAVLVKYTGDAAEVVVPDTYEGKPIVKIGESAFENNTKITKVSLPDTIQVIGKRAFAGCTSLAEMD